MKNAPHIESVGRVAATARGPVARLFGRNSRRRQVVLPKDAPPAGSVVAVRLSDGRRPARWSLLASPGTARAALYDLLERYDLDPYFPPAVEREVAAIVARPGIDDPALVDLTDLPFVTIDNADSKDLDQALHIARDGDGYLLSYALADASYYVPPGSALFAEALRRGASFYLPGLSVPMLPRALSEGLVSLNPRVDRRALVFRVRLDAGAAVRETTLVRARVRSRAQLTYEGVQAHLDGPARGPLAGQPYTESLALLREVGERRIAEARERDVVDYDRTAMEVHLSEDGAAFVAAPEARNDVDRYNEQISVLCNTEGARFMLADLDAHPNVQPIYRVHDAPAEARLAELHQRIGGIVRAHRLDDRRWQWRRGDEPLADYLERLPEDAPTADVRTGIARQVMVTNERSVFSSAPARHYALGVEVYGRFTAPMRELVGVFTHKEALEKLSNTGHDDIERDRALRDEVIRAAQGAKSLQRNLDKAIARLAIDQLLRADLALPVAARPAREGVVLGLTGSRLYVQLRQPPIDVKVYTRDLEALSGARYAAEPGEVVLAPEGKSKAPRYQIGDVIRVRTAGYDPAAHRWRLVPV